MQQDDSKASPESGLAEAGLAEQHSLSGIGAAARKGIYPAWIIIPSILILLLVFYFFDPTQWAIFPRCMWNQLTGTHCPGCGGQRALYDLAHGNILSALSHNPLLFILGPITLYWFSLDAGLKLGRRTWVARLYTEKGAPFMILGIIVGFWVLRNLPWMPFSWMAP